MIRSSGGVFEVKMGEEILFSKKRLGRHAEPGEVADTLAARLGRPG